MDADSNFFALNSLIIYPFFMKNLKTKYEQSLSCGISFNDSIFDKFLVNLCNIFSFQAHWIFFHLIKPRAA